MKNLRYLIGFTIKEPPHGNARKLFDMFGGWRRRWRHKAPPRPKLRHDIQHFLPGWDNEPPPVLYWLSG